MKFRSTWLFPLLCAALSAQQPPKPLDLADSVPDAPILRTSVSNVQAPVTVLDRNGYIVNGLQPQQFRLYDNGKEQDIRVDVASQPLSLVIVIQCSTRVEAILNQIKKAANLFGPQVIGEEGEAAVLAFDHRIREMQSFTNDSQKIVDAIKKINVGSNNARLIDAVDKAVYLLRSRPATRRRVVLLISENRDVASEGKMREALLDAQLTNVSVYSVNISRVASSITAEPQPGRPDPLPATAYSLPGGVPSTPTSVAQKTQAGNRIEFIPAFKEIYKDVKGVFVANPTEIFTHETGGSQYGFIKERGLEDAIQGISDDIHSQYIVSYNPNNQTEGGFHDIEIRLDDPKLKTRTRPGYYLASIGK
jgi:VWFA-related protein